jgi:hypothetical protein
MLHRIFKIACVSIQATLFNNQAVLNLLSTMKIKATHELELRLFLSLLQFCIYSELWKLMSDRHQRVADWSKK